MAHQPEINEPPERDRRANIKLDRETFEALKADKPDGVTWDRYLLELRTLGGHK